jgi:hypothetical protein
MERLRPIVLGFVVTFVLATETARSLNDSGARSLPQTQNPNEKTRYEY